MKSFYTIIAVALTLLFANGSFAAENSGEKKMKIQKIMSKTLKDIPTYQGWPTIVRTRDNKLIAVCSGNRQKHVCPFGRVWMFISADEGKSWQGPTALSEGPLDDRDAGICEAADGSLLVTYFTSTAAIFRGSKLNPKWKEIAASINLLTLREEHAFWMRRSTDGGKTWSKKYRVPVNSPHGPTLMKNGKLFFAGQKAGPASGQMIGTPYYSAAFSEDNGRTWKELSSIPLPAGHDRTKIHEAHGIEAPDGTLIVQYRNHFSSGMGETWQTESADGGKSWSKPHFVCKGFPTHLQIFGKDKLIMTYSYRSKPNGIRARISHDSGKSWSDEIILTDDAKSWDFGYPSTVEMADGTLFTLWYENPGRAAKLRMLRWKIEE